MVDNGCEKQAYGNEELISGDYGAAHGFGRDFRHVQDDDCGDETDAYACDEAARHEERDGCGSDLEDDAEGEDSAAGDDCGASPDPVGERASKESTEEGAGGEDGGYEGLLPGAVHVAIVGVGVG